MKRFGSACCRKRESNGPSAGKRDLLICEDKDAYRQATAAKVTLLAILVGTRRLFDSCRPLDERVAIGRVTPIAVPA